MDLFSLVDADMLRKAISQHKPLTCLLDPIPTTFFGTVFNCISEEVQAIVYPSLFTGTSPTAPKTSMVKPFLKKSHLDTSALSNFLPISNLPFFSRILEKLVFKQLNYFLKCQLVFVPTTAQRQPFMLK
jgi:hypothetical protein